MTDEATEINFEGRTVNQALLLALINGLNEKLGILINAQKEGVKTAMDAAEKAVAKAESAADKRFEALNELRGMASDWRTEFARQSTVDLQIKGITDKIELMRNTIYETDKKVNEVVSRGSGGSAVWAAVAVIITIVISAAVLGVLIATRLH